MVMLAVSYFNSYYHYPQKNCQAHYSYGYVNCPEFFRAKIFSRIHYLEYFFCTLLLLTHCTMYLDLITILPVYMAIKKSVVGYIFWLREIQSILKTTQCLSDASISKSIIICELYWESSLHHLTVCTLNMAPHIISEL